MTLGRPRLHLRQTDSTNERAKALVLAGAPHGTLVTAGAQSAGHGRRGRPWVAPPGSSVLASLIVRGSGEGAPYLPLAAAVAASEACERCAPVTCAIKWPNDVWIDGRKAAGILLEGRRQEGWAVLGIGINVSTRAEDFPPDLRSTATSLAAASERAAPAAALPAVEDVLGALLEAVAAHLAEPPKAIVSAWSERDALRDRPVQWEGGEGIARGLAPSGALRVETASGAHELHAGEVALVRPSA